MSIKVANDIDHRNTRDLSVLGLTDNTGTPIVPASGIPASTTGYKVIAGTTVQQQLSSADALLVNARSTGLIWGGKLVGTSPTFTVEAGEGAILLNNDPVNPVFVRVTWATQTSKVPLGEGQNYVYVDTAGVIQQQTAKFTNKDYRRKVALGRVTVAGGVITVVQPMPVPIRAVANEVSDLANSFGNFIESGLRISAAGANLKVALSAGVIYAHGANFYTDPEDPSRITLVGTSPKGLRYLVRSGTQLTTSDVTDLTPGVYDNGTSAPVAVPGGGVLNANDNDATNQRLYLFPSGNLRAQPGQTIYTDLAAALAAVQTEAFVVNPNILGNGILLGVWSVVRTATNLQDTTQAQFTPADKYGQLTGGSAVATAATASTPAALTRTSTVQAFGSGNTNFDMVGYAAPSVFGNTESRNIVAGNALTKARRLGVKSFSNGNGGSVSLVMGGSHLCGSDLTAVFVWGNADAITSANGRGFYGFTGSASRIDNQNPVSQLNIVGVGSEAGDANLSLLCNDGAGTATKTGLGNSFPANTNSLDAYRLVLTFATAGTAIGYTITNLSSGVTTSGSLTTNIPAASVVLTAQLYRNLTADAGIYPTFDFMHYSTAGDL